MSKEEMKQKVLNKLKARPDIKHIEQDFLVDVVDDAIDDAYYFINARNDDDLIESLETPIKDLCVVRLNLVGTEGLVSSSKSGTSESFLNDIPKPIKAKLRKYRNLP